MNRELRRASQKNGRSQQKKSWDKFKDVTAESIQKHKDISGNNITFYADKVYQNNKYIVQEYRGCLRKGRYYTKLMIRRSDAQAIHSWSDLYRIKNELYGEDVEAIEFYPPKSQLVDVANLYWLWIEEGLEND